MDKTKRKLIGQVVSVARDKTVTVVVKNRVKHALYGKIVTKFKKYHAHDENNQYKQNDVVIIVPTRPISKTKSWVVEALFTHE